MSTRKHGDPPISLGVISLDVQEMMFYQYLPIKLNSGIEIKREERLGVFDQLIGKVCCDFIAEFGLDQFVKSYVYITAKNMFQSGDNSYNRLGFHTDGFMSADINYIWSNASPTIFSGTGFKLTQHDELSLLEMQEQEKESDRYSFDNCAVLRLDEYVVHAVQPIIDPGYRCFVKISFSPDRYNLIGNSKNYLLDYDWEMYSRQKNRNIPQRTML
jgi:hypothetical protein